MNEGSMNVCVMHEPVIARMIGLTDVPRGPEWQLRR